ncbi:MAG: hypothetical protein HZB80_11310 [Deltaproteobacteria bacterium]|nr:hypothetical protein [Deltaproteobacteria bacterium]
MTISEIEDRLITVIKGLSLFKWVDSMGRKGLPATLNYPAALIYFLSEKNTETKPRPVMILTYEAAVIDKNVQSEAKAAKDIYSLVDAVRDAINGKTLEITDIEPFVCGLIEFADYDGGKITYTMQFQTRHYLPVPAE